MKRSRVQKRQRKVVRNWRYKTEAIEKFQFVHYFLPHPEGKSRAPLLSSYALIVYGLVIIILMGIFRIIPSIVPGVLGYASDINVKQLLDYTNQERKDAGLPTLRLNEKLTEAAGEKAKHMFEHNYWAHIAPDGTEPWDFILGKNYDYSYAGENLAKNFYYSKEVINAWMKSPSHRDNLLSPNYNEIGFAVVNGVLDGYETTLVVQIFGKPRDLTQIATAPEEEILLKKLGQGAKIAAPEAEKEQIRPLILPRTSEEVLPSLDVNIAMRGVSVAIGMFVFTLLILDIWYSKKKGLFKFTGNTWAHVILMIFVMVGVWFVLKPGKIL